MTLNNLIKTASRGYPDNLIEQIHHGQVLPYGGFASSDGASDPVGDGLASFVVSELTETFDRDASNKEQLDTAIDVIDRSIKDLTGVLNSLLKERFN